MAIDGGDSCRWGLYEYFRFGEAKNQNTLISLVSNEIDAINGGVRCCFHSVFENLKVVNPLLHNVHYNGHFISSQKRSVTLLHPTILIVYSL